MPRLLFLLLLPVFVLAKEQTIPQCNKITLGDEITSVEIPETFNTSNNLLRKSGAMYTALGQKISVHAKLVDVNCVPISDATVYMWQKDANGLYHYNKSESQKQDEDKYFLGNGTAITDNLGRFCFITIMPKELNGDLPSINLIVQHEDFDKFYTKVFFEPKTDKKDVLKGKLVAKKSLNDNSYEFEIMLDKKLKFLSY